VDANVVLSVKQNLKIEAYVFVSECYHVVIKFYVIIFYTLFWGVLTPNTTLLLTACTTGAGCSGLVQREWSLVQQMQEGLQGQQTENDAVWGESIEPWSALHSGPVQNMDRFHEDHRRQDYQEDIRIVSWGSSNDGPWEVGHGFVWIPPGPHPQNRCTKATRSSEWIPVFYCLTFLFLFFDVDESDYAGFGGLFNAC